MNTCKEKDVFGFVHSFETLGALDGPGIRTVVFLSGCPMRCAYCHNPDTWQLTDGTKMSAQEVVRRVKRYQPYFGEKGGITLSGGEPLLQTEFSAEIFRLCQKEGISTVLDTSGAVVNEHTEMLLEQTDLVMLDIKHTEAEAFHALTQYSMEPLLCFAQRCKTKQKRLWLRQVTVPGITADEENIYKLRDFARQFHAEKTELLPYHEHGVFKWERLGVPYTLSDTKPPEEALMKHLNQILLEKQ